MHQAGSTEEERKQQLLSTGALSPDSIRSADSDVTRDMNARLAGACRLGDKEMAAQLIQQGAQINAVSGEVCPLVVAAAADEVGFGFRVCLQSTMQCDPPQMGTHGACCGRWSA